MKKLLFLLVLGFMLLVTVQPVSASGCTVSGPYPYTTNDGFPAYRTDVNVGTHYLSLIYVPQFQSIQSTTAPLTYSKTVDSSGNFVVTATYKLAAHTVHFMAVTQPVSFDTTLSVSCK